MKIPGKYYIQSSACKNSKHQSQLPCWVARRKQGPSKRLTGMDNLIIYKLQNLCDERLRGLLSVILNSDFFSSLGGFKIFLRGKYLSVRKWMIGLTLLTDNTQITTKNWSKNKFQPTFNVKVYLTTKTDKIILSQHITDLLTPTSHSPQLSLPIPSKVIGAEETSVTCRHLQDQSVGATVIAVYCISCESSFMSLLCERSRVSHWPS